MIWADVQTGLIAAVRLALEDADYDVGWTDREARFRDEAHVRLSVLANVSRGRGERRYAADGADDVRERIYDPRRLVVQIRCETRDQDLDESAMAIAERIEQGLKQSDVEALLDAAQIGIAKIEAPTQVNAPDSGGAVRSIAVLDVRFNAHGSKTGPLVPRVRAVEVTGTIENGPNVGPLEIP